MAKNSLRGHKCTSKQFKAFVVEQVAEEDLEMQAEEEDETLADVMPANERGDVDPAEISLNAIIGWISCSTLRLAGSICGRSVLILIDSGSTHSFLFMALVKELGITVE